VTISNMAKVKAMAVAIDRDVLLYLSAKERLCQSGFAREIDWQLGREFGAFSERDLLREVAWVVLCSGFREAIVRQHFDFISLCFCDWESAAAICRHADQCRATALTEFGNGKKLDAIVGTAIILDRIGFLQFKHHVLDDPIPALRTLPFIGPVTAFHLAKNLGLGTAKPDRHLERLARSKGYAGAHHLCSALAVATGDPIQVVDIVLWRYSERRYSLAVERPAPKGKEAS
jgi:hypothetical protein